MDECGIYGVIQTEETLTGTVSSDSAICGRLDTEGTLVGSVGFPSCEYPTTYKGEYVFTPSSEEQVVPLNGKMATDDILINPIPSNYGLITWDGSVITVS